MTIVHAVLLALHVLGATIWTGGHLVLAIGFLPGALRERDPQIILDFESRFERIGIPALVAQIATGIPLALPYLPTPDTTISIHLAGTLICKVVLLMLTVGLAAHARLRLIPRLGPDNLKVLARHIIAVTVIAVLLVILGVGIPLGPGAS